MHYGGVMFALDQAKDTAHAKVTSHQDELINLSHEVWDHPELAFEEEHAAKVCADVLSGAGFDVTMGIAGLPTAFVAEYGSGPLTIGICSELDALPGIGHACGHNMIAAAGVGAGLGLMELADDAGITIRVYGTPAEEGGGGKIIMLEDGAFDGIHASMMIHPAPQEMDVFTTLASNSCEYHFHGKNAHASMAPWEGRNALDAVTIAQVAMGLLRQQLPPHNQVHGMVTDGGLASNIIPAHAAAKYQVRAPTVTELHPLEDRVRKCFEAAALATGCDLEVVRSMGAPYSEFRHDDGLVGFYRSNAEALGRVFGPPSVGASTDMANLSLIMPTIHPIIGLECDGAVNHQPEFAQHCRTEQADKGMLEGAISMAQTVIDAAHDEATRNRLLAGNTTYGGRDDYPWHA